MLLFSNRGTFRSQLSLINFYYYLVRIAFVLRGGRHRFKSLYLQLGLLPLQLLLTSPHLVIVVDIAALAFTLGVDKSFPGMRTITRHRTPPVFVVAVITHAHRV